MTSENTGREVSVSSDPERLVTDVPEGVDRRAFMRCTKLPADQLAKVTGLNATDSLLVEAMALTAKEMNAKYKETSEGGLAVSLVLC
jgi:L-serine deaminase